MEAVTIDIAASPERVWSVMADIGQWPGWTATVKHVKWLDAGPLKFGSRVLIHQPKLPPTLWTVTELTPGSGFTWVSGLPGMRAIATHKIVPATHKIVPATNGCQVVLAVHYRGMLGKLLSWITQSIARRYIEMEARGLKQRCEQLEIQA